MVEIGKTILLVHGRYLPLTASFTATKDRKGSFTGRSGLNMHTSVLVQVVLDGHKGSSSKIVFREILLPEVQWSPLWAGQLPGSDNSPMFRRP